MDQDSQIPPGSGQPQGGSAGGGPNRPLTPGSRRPVATGGLGAAPPPPPPGYPQVVMPPQRTGDSWTLRTLRWMLSSLLIFSILLNLFLLMRLGLLSAGPQEKVYTRGDATRRITILPIEGPIFDVTDQFVHEALNRLETDPPAALLLRIDSPGGAVAASDRIAQRLHQFREATGVPVLASYGGEAASGAYYISAASDRIIAEPTCVTGSIGVIMPAFTIEQLLDKIGVTPRTVIAGGATRKDVGSLTRAWTDDDRQVLQGIIDHMHARFVDTVAEGRGLSLEAAHAVADGAPLTVEQALERKLIDSVGYLPDAIDQAAEAAGLPENVQPHVTIIRMHRGLGGLSPLGAAWSASSWLDHQLQAGMADAWFGRQPLYMRSP